MNKTDMTKDFADMGIQLQQATEQVDEMRSIIRRIIGALWFLFLMLSAATLFAYVNSTVRNILFGCIYVFTIMLTFIRRKMKKRAERDELDTIACVDARLHDFKNLRDKTPCRNCGKTVGSVKQELWQRKMDEVAD